MDISIIGSNRSIIRCVEFCKARNITTEFVQNIEQAVGKYICIVDPDVYYYEYYLSYQYVMLEYKKAGKGCSHFDWSAIVVYDSSRNDFYSGNYTNRNIFYLKNFDKVVNYVEKEIYLGCIRDEELSYCNLELPPDGELVRYYKYFLGNE